jgi:hypothetical protein
MALHLFVFVLLLVVCLLFLLVLLWRLDWFPLRPPASPQGGLSAARSPVCVIAALPDYCLTCRLASTASSAGEPTPVPVRP